MTAEEQQHLERHHDHEVGGEEEEEELQQQDRRCMEEMVRNHDKLFKLEVALKNYNSEMEKADSFHRECLRLWEDLNKSNKELRESLNNSKKTSNDAAPAAAAPSNGHSNSNVDSMLCSTLMVQNRLQTIKYHIPEHTGAYLKAMIGPISLFLPTREAKFAYKNNYENLKLTQSVVSICLSLLLLLINNKYLDSIYSLNLLWYYSTLTIRERILKLNGSNIRKWWFLHHMLSVANSCILITWSFESQSYQEFRKYMLVFSVYLSAVSFVQCYYQKGCLYRQYALGYSKNKMDVTVDGFVSWMWKNLGFLLPLLIISYLIEIFLVYKLLQINQAPMCKEWQPAAIAFFFGVMSVGNIITVCILIKRKVSASNDLRNFRFSQYCGIDKLLDSKSSQLSKFYSTMRQYHNANAASASAGAELSNGGVQPSESN